LTLTWTGSFSDWADRTGGSAMAALAGTPLAPFGRPYKRRRVAKSKRSRRTGMGTVSAANRLKDQPTSDTS